MGRRQAIFLDQKIESCTGSPSCKRKDRDRLFFYTYRQFALNAALGEAKHVTAVDVFNTALEEGRANAKTEWLGKCLLYRLMYLIIDTLKHHQFDFQQIFRSTSFYKI